MSTPRMPDDRFPNDTRIRRAAIATPVPEPPALRVFRPYPHPPVVDADLEARDANVLVRRRAARPDVDPPAVQRARDHGPVEPPGAERTGHVRARVVHGVERAAGAEERDPPTADLDRATLSLAQPVDARDFDVSGHTAIECTRR